MSIKIQAIALGTFALCIPLSPVYAASVYSPRTVNLEVAGADETDKATTEQLRRAGTEMIPSENLKKSKAMSSPTMSSPTVPSPAVPIELTPKAQPPKPLEKPEMAAPIKTQPASTPVPVKETATPMTAGHAIAGPYLRLDAGYGFTLNADGTQSAGDFTAQSISNVPVASLGIGYKHNDNFRADITINYLPDTDVRATTTAGNTASTEVGAIAALINGYWDITKIEAITPYLGAGIGFARLSTSNQTTTGGIATEGGKTTNNFAWALMAGTAIEISENLAADIGYRFLNLGGFKQQGTTSYEDLLTHEARAGLRYGF